MFTSGTELTTALTNILIFLSSLIFVFKIDKKDKLWRYFFILLSIAGLFGIIIHGIAFNDKIIEILWYILSFIFSIIINILLTIFLNIKKKLSTRANKLLTIGLVIFIYLIIVIETINKIDFILTYSIYVAICMLLIVAINISMLKNKNYYYLLGILFQVIGGVFLLNKNVLFLGLDHNGIYHLFMVGTIIMFYKGYKKDAI